MAQIDSNIYFQQQGADILGSVQKGLSVRDMLDKKAKAQKQDEKDQNLQKAYNAGIVKNQDGSVSYDGNKTASELAGLGYGKEAYEAQNQFKQQTAMDQKAKQEQSQIQNEMVARVGQDVLKNPSLWPSVRNSIISQGFATENDLPSVYDENFVKNSVGMALTNLQKLDQQFKEKQFSADQSNKDRSYNLDKQKVANEGLKAKGEGVKRSVDDKKMGSYVTEGLRGVGGMRSALDAGDNTFSMIGDNDFTRSLNQMAENFGRMQSGGAINKDEEERFKKMAPGIGDSAEMQQKKLNAMETMFRERAGTYSVDLDSAGLSNRNSPNAPLNSKPSWAK